MTIETTQARPLVEGDPAAMGGRSHPGRRRVAGSGSADRTSLRNAIAAFTGSPGTPALERDHDPSLLTHCGFQAMTTQVGLWLYGNHPESRQHLEEAKSWVKQTERQLSRFRADSELSVLNRAAGRGPHRVSPLLFDVVRASLDLADEFPGLVDPTVLPALVRAGYGPGEPDGRIDHGKVRLDHENLTITLAERVSLDLGGVAKGWIADILANRLKPLGACLVDVGGDLRAAGSLAWPVGLEDPKNTGRTLAVFHLQDSAVATSSLLKRRWGNNQNHLIDPRTAEPVNNDLVAVSVRASTATLAEGLAKAALILGRREGRALLEERGARGVLFGKEPETV
jgi:FAD:protein FMN transferase